MERARKRLSVWFTRPFDVRVLEEVVAPPGPGQVLVETIMSGISPGTEMLFYHGEAPQGLAIDTSIATLSGTIGYPMKYGYSTVGRVAATGTGVDPGLAGRRVFSFNPHENLFLASPADLVPVPESVRTEDAVLLPSMETAVNLVLDGRPCLGEKAVVIGQGIIGLLTTAVLSLHPLDSLVTVDRFGNRRRASVEAGAIRSLDPGNGEVPRFIKSLGDGRADLVLELSGSPAALDLAIELAGFGGRIVIGSWYGGKRAPLDLGGRFHRERITIESSQVSTISPRLAPRWTKERRLDTAWRMMGLIRPSRWITQTFPLARADEAYAFLDTSPDKAIQVVLDHAEDHTAT